MAAAQVPSDIVLAVAAIIAQVAKVRGFLLVDSSLVQPQFRVRAKSPTASVAGDPSNPGMKGFVGFQAVPPGGAEVAVFAAVGFDSFVADPHMLLQASRLLAGEVAKLALQMRSVLRILLVKVSVSIESRRRYASKGAERTLELPWF